MRKIYIFLLMLMSFACFGQLTPGPGSADSTAAKKVISKLTAFYKSHIPEHSYLHFDKPYYAAGDTIYFKAYVTIGDQHALSDMSRILYADLVDPQNQVKQSLKLRLMYGTTWGDFVLPDTLPKGNYRIRAYTRWMLNEQTGHYFDRVIPVETSSTGKIPEALTNNSSKSNKTDIQFMPEGGALISDVKSKIAFKAIGPDGLGINLKGEIVDNQNNPVCTFASAHLGMGYFNIFAEEGKTYKAKITYPDGSKAIFDMPTADPNGISLAVDNDLADAAIVRLGAGKTFYAANKNNNFTVLIYSGGEVSTYICKLDARQIVFGVSKHALHSGIAYATLYSPIGEPLAERLIFVQHNDQLNLKISSGNTGYAKREKVNLNLSAKDKNGSPSTGQFSVSVTDENLVPVEESKENTILTDLLLTDDLKGYVEQPNYYFTNMSDKTISDLDLVMLTNGYRRFQWERILNNTYPQATLQPEKALEIDGNVTLSNGKSLLAATISLFPIGRGPVLTQSVAKDGSFRFDSLSFMDSSHFVLKAINGKWRDNTKITYIKNTPPSPSNDDPNLIFEQADLNSATTSYLENKKAQLDDQLKYKLLTGIVLKEVKVKGTTYKSTNLGGAGFADQVISRGKFTISGGVFSQQFDRRLTGISFIGPEGRKNPYVMMARSLSQNLKPMLLVLDGMEIMPDSAFSVDDLVNVNDIETVEVLTSAANEAIYGINSAAGVLVITTRHGDDQDPNVQEKGLLTISPKGFYKARQFYSPKYDHAETGFARKDLRSTVYWNPQLITNKEGEAAFDFYNADGTGNYRVVVEGIDANGNIGRQVYHYKVE